MWPVAVFRNLKCIYASGLPSSFCVYKIFTQTYIRKKELDIMKSSKISEILNIQPDMKHIDWRNIKQSLASLDFISKDLNLDFLILQHYIKQKSPESASNFVNYLKTSNDKLQLSAISMIFRHYFTHYKDKKLPAEDKSYIFKLYADLTSKYSLLDLTISESCILVLSLTEKWKECFVIFDKLKLHNKPTSIIFSVMIIASFDNNEPEIGWKLLNEMADLTITPNNLVYTSWINYCIRNISKNPKEMIKSIEKLLYYTVENNFVFEEDVIKKICDVFTNSLGWKSSLVNINKIGHCNSCNTILMKSTMTSAEHEILKNAFYKEVMIGKNIFIKSRPEEIQNYLNYIEKTGPYDMVVDALNVAFSIPKVATFADRSRLLKVVVRGLIDGGRKKIFVLGRKHMLKWPNNIIDFLENNTYLYLVDDLSYDDTFLLYAALNAKHTDFLSRDMMRGHKFLLLNEKILFGRWQLSHQHSLIHADINGTGNLIIKKPPKFVSYAHKNVNWHIPYKINDLQKENSQLPFYWACLRPPN